MKKTFFVVVAAILSLTIFLPVYADAWCTDIPDDQSITVLSIPGTHDSGTVSGDILHKCQSMQIQDQLKCGVRFLDMRVGWHKNKVYICHGTHWPNYMDLTLEQALMQVYNFLSENPREFVILQFKVDDGTPDMQLIPEIEKVIYNGTFNQKLYDKSEVPTVGEVRGKMIYWHRWAWALRPGLEVWWQGAPGNYSWDYSNYYVRVSDLYDYGIDSKVREVKRYLDWAKGVLINYDNCIILTFCSTSTGDKGCGWQPKKSAAKINPEVQAYLRNQQARYFGIVIVDFVTRELAENIWRLNFKPAPRIEANGATGAVTVNSPDTVSITVELNAQAYTGVPADWWVIVNTGSAWYSMDSAGGWTQIGDCRPVYQGRLGNLPAREVLNIAGLGSGSYTFYFAVDYPMNGVLNLEQIYANSVTVNIQ